MRWSPVLARKPPSRPGKCCIRLSRVLMKGVSRPRLRLARLASRNWHPGLTGISAASDTRLLLPSVTVTKGSGRVGPECGRTAASGPGRICLRRPARRRGPPPSFCHRPGLASGWMDTGLYQRPDLSHEVLEYIFSASQCLNMTQ